MLAWQTKFDSMPLVLSAASSWVVMDRLLAPRWQQVGPRARTASVPPLSTHSIAHPHACLCWPLPLRARTSDAAGAEAKAVRDFELHAAAARAASRAHRRCRGRLERPWLAALPQRPTDGRLLRRAVFASGQPPPSGVMHPLVVFDDFDDFGGGFDDFGNVDAT